MFKIIEKKRPTMKGWVECFAIQREDGFEFCQRDDRKECQEFIDVANEIDNNLPVIDLSEIEVIEVTNKGANTYDSDSGDFYVAKSTQVLFETPIGKIRVWDNDTFESFGKIGTGKPFYSDGKYNHVDEPATCGLNYDGWWKPNTSMTIKEQYVNKNEILVCNKLTELFYNAIN